MLTLTGVRKVFFPHTVNERVALKGANLHLEQGDFVTVIGSNGAGKSTLLNVVAGRVIPDAGRVEVDGQNLTKVPEYRRARIVSRVFQDPMAGTAPNLTIEENLAIAMGRGRGSGLRTAVTRARRERFREELATLELGLENRLRTGVGMLSGGQRQALSLLMATFVEPRILLLDEHTAALDPSRAAKVSELTSAAVARHNLTALMVTHNMTQAIEMGNRLIMMHDGDIVLDIPASQKKDLTAQHLLDEFARIKGAELSDRTLLGG